MALAAVTRAHFKTTCILQNIIAYHLQAFPLCAYYSIKEGVQCSCTFHVFVLLKLCP